MAQAYGTVLIVLSAGFVVFVLMLSFMAFRDPAKGQVFLNNFMGPALGLIAAYALKSGHEWLTTKGAK